MRNYYLLLFIFLGFACGPGSVDSSLEGSENTIPYFEHFPEQPFMNLNWLELKDTAISKLNNDGFEANIYSTNNTHFNNKTHNIEFVFHEFSENLVSFKVFLKSAKDLEQKSAYTDYFSGLAESSNHSEQFSIYYFETTENDFKVTLYSQKDFLRFEFVLQESH